jgi:preprotein translocase subunit SecA
VAIRRENQTLASITFQNLFRMYEKLSGMTGTAETEAPEFLEIYRLPVVVIPTNMPMIRADESDVVFRTRNEKYDAAIQDIEEINATGQPVLVGTITIDQSEELSRKLRQKEIKHNVLNAKHHEREAEIVAQAGRWGAVTISTNMAGRGTDIMLGGNPEFLAQAEAKTKDSTEPAYQAALQTYRSICQEEKKKVIEAGGLFIMGTERHESRRIDNQLRGRSGRQGDPGKSRFYISLEDDLMKRFGGDRIQGLMTKLGWEAGVAMDGRLISRSIETAQQRVERMHFDSRKHVTEYDDVMNKQRQVVYNLRAKVLFNQDVRDEIYGMMDDLIEDSVLTVCDNRTKPIDWNLSALGERFQFLFNRAFNFPDETVLEQQAIFDVLRTCAHALYDTRTKSLTEKLSALESLTMHDGTPIRFRFSRDDENPMDFSAIERDTVLETLDHFWNLHLQEMDYLREGIGLRGYGQLNPLHEYQREGFEMFQAMLNNMRETVVRKLSYYEVPAPEELIAHVEAERRRREELERQLRLHHTSQLEGGPDDAAAPPKDPNAERAKREAQKRARRKKKR